jgi:hypothetical protein
MNSRNQTETEKNQDENPTTQNYIKSKYESLNSFLDDEDSKYISNKENTGTENSNYYSDISKKDILSNINKLIEENDKKDQNFIYNKNIINENIDEKINNIKNINTSNIISLTLELKELKKTNKIMKETIQDLKNEISLNELQYKENINKELNKQKYEYEEKIEELKLLIENLINEKKNLNEKINNINNIYEKKENEYKNKINEIIEYYKLENEKNKDAWYKAEKLRRKKWEENKIKEIKEITIKNLEPELDKILKDHKKELIEKEENLKDNFRIIKEKLIINYENKIENMKKIYIKEKEELQEKERKEYIKRLREQNIRLEDQHNSEQKKWYINLQDEIKRLEELRNKDKINYENDLINLTNKYNKLIEEKEKYWKENIDKLNNELLKKDELKYKDDTNNDITKYN